MSLNMIWRHEDKIYAIADSAVSKTGTQDQHSSFGEWAPSQVKEGAQKIVPIGNSLVTLLVGDADGGGVFLDYLFEYSDLLAPRHLLESAANSLSPWHGEHFVVKFGYFENDEPIVGLWDSQDGFHYLPQDASAYCDGNITPVEQQEVYRLLEIASHYAKYPEVALPLVQGLLQLRAGHSTWFAEKGIGGAFFGGYLKVTGFSWQQPTLFVLYGPRSLWQLPGLGNILDGPASGFLFVSTEVFMNACVIWSSDLPTWKVISIDRLVVDEEEWLSAYRAQSENSLPFSYPATVVFLNKLHNQLGLIHPPSLGLILGIEHQPLSVKVGIQPFLYRWLYDRILPNGKSHTSTDGFLILNIAKVD